MAEPSNCQFGFIANETVDDINVDGQNCYINDTLVLGDVTVRNGGEVVIRKSRVFGTVRIVDSSDIGFFDNVVVNGNVLVIRPITAYIANNALLRSGQGSERRMVIRGVGANNETEGEEGEGEGEALIFENTVEEGTIRCRNNNGQAFARGNIAESVTCPGDPS
jgi:hypothetical protein